MNTPYIDPDIANGVLARLKLVAAKWKKKQLSLHVFLEIQPEESYDQWNGQLGELSRRFSNQANKPGKREAVDLCTLLEGIFTTAEGWAGLLNQLGRLQIETRVEQMAEAASPPDVLRQQFNAFTHEIRQFVGAPNAEAVVKDLFEEKGLSLPRPADHADEQSEETQSGSEPDEDEEDQDVATEVAASATGARRGKSRTRSGNHPRSAAAARSDRETQKEPQSIWATLGTLLANVAVQALTAKAEMSRERAADPEPPETTVNVSGTWRNEEGARISFTQRGGKVEVEGWALNQALKGQGVVRGSQMELLVWLLSQRTKLRVLLNVGRDGLRGTAQDDFGNAIPVFLHR